MAGVLSAVRANSQEIMKFVRSLSANSRFWVAAFNDYPNLTNVDTSYPWRLYQDLTPDMQAAPTVLERIQSGYGGDLPEAYGRAL